MNRHFEEESYNSEIVDRKQSRPYGILLKENGTRLRGPVGSKA